MFGSIEREGKNTRIRGTEADIIKTAMGAGFDPDGKPFLWHTLRELSAAAVLMVHDELVVEAPEEDAQTVAGADKDCFLRAGKMFLRHVDMLSDEHIGECWSK